MEHDVVIVKQPIQEDGTECCWMDVTYLLKNAKAPNPKKSKQSDIVADPFRPPRSNAYNDDGK